LKNAGVTLNLSNVKGPVMDVLIKTDFQKVLTGRVYLSHYQAMEVLAPESLQEEETYA
jgi:SulP family sulfate permease